MVINIINNNTVSLKILEAYTRDVGRGIGRIDYDTLKSLDASAGDIMEIAGGKKEPWPSACPCIPAMKVKA